MTAVSTGRSAFAAALALLTGRALTVGELAVRLRRRGCDDGAIAETTARLLELGYLDDRRTAAAWAESAVHLRGFGPRRLRAGLLKRLLSDEIAEEVVADLFPAGEEARFAQAVLAKWERSRGPVADARSRSAAYAHLRRRGFSSAASRGVLFNRREIE